MNSERVLHVNRIILHIFIMTYYIWAASQMALYFCYSALHKIMHYKGNSVPFGTQAWSYV